MNTRISSINFAEIPWVIQFIPFSVSGKRWQLKTHINPCKQNYLLNFGKHS